MVLVPCVDVNEVEGIIGELKRGGFAEAGHQHRAAAAKPRRSIASSHLKSAAIHGIVLNVLVDAHAPRAIAERVVFTIAPRVDHEVAPTTPDAQVVCREVALVYANFCADASQTQCIADAHEIAAMACVDDAVVQITHTARPPPRCIGIDILQRRYRHATSKSSRKRAPL